MGLLLRSAILSVLKAISMILYLYVDLGSIPYGQFSAQRVISYFKWTFDSEEETRYYSNSMIQISPSRLLSSARPPCITIAS
jgi:hypothetical protein